MTPRFHKTSIWNLKEGDQIRFARDEGEVEWVAAEQVPEGQAPKRVLVDLRTNTLGSDGNRPLRHYVLSETDRVEKRRLTLDEILAPFKNVPGIAEGKRIGTRVKIETSDGLRYVRWTVVQGDAPWPESHFEFITKEQADALEDQAVFANSEADYAGAAQFWADRQPEVRKGELAQVEPVYESTERGQLVSKFLEKDREHVRSGPSAPKGPRVYLAGFQIAVSEEGRRGWCVPASSKPGHYRIQNDRPAHPSFGSVSDVIDAREWISGRYPKAQQQVEAEYAEERTHRIVTEELGMEF